MEPGYRTIVRTYDVQGSKVRVWAFEVQGTEEVEVPAGSYDTFKVSMQALDGEGGGGTLWVTQSAPRMTVRSEYALPPAMGGGTVSSALTSTEMLD